MTKIELRDLIVPRVGWKAPVTQGYVPSAEAQTSDSDRYFQDEHEFVKIDLVQNLFEIPSSNNSQKDAKLMQLKNAVALHVVDECFPNSVLPEIDFTETPDLFDAAYAKRMALKIAEMLFASERSNRAERIAKESIQQFFFDINGDPNYPNKLSISKLYDMELQNIKDLFNTNEALDVVTLQ